MVTCGYDSITKHQKNMLPWQDSTKSLLPNKCRCKFPTPCWYAQKTTETNSGFPKKSHHSLGGDVGTHRFGKKNKNLYTPRCMGAFEAPQLQLWGTPPSKHQTANSRFDRKTNDVASLKMNSSHLQGSLSKRTKFHLPTSNYQVIFSLLSGRVR